jgi:hypothetical protein
MTLQTHGMTALVNSRHLLAIVEIPFTAYALCLVPCALCLVPCALCLVPCVFCRRVQAPDQAQGRPALQTRVPPHEGHATPLFCRANQAVYLQYAQRQVRNQLPLLLSLDITCNSCKPCKHVQHVQTRANTCKLVQTRANANPCSVQSVWTA